MYMYVFCIYYLYYYCINDDTVNDTMILGAVLQK